MKGFLWFAAVIGILLLGWIPTAKLVQAIWRIKVPQIVEVIRDPSQEAWFPGNVDLELQREGAYAIHYLEHDGAYAHAIWPPKLDCRLSEATSGREIPLVSDYVPTNRHETDGGQVGVMIYSTTIQDPGIHTLSCDYTDGKMGPKFGLIVGPNHVFEFLRLVLPLGLGLFAALIVASATTFISTALLVAGLILQKKHSN